MARELNRETPINFEIVNKNVEKFGKNQIALGNIRVIVKMVKEIEDATGENFIKMAMGIPGLKPSSIGINAEIEALKKDVVGVYPPVDGVPELKKEIARFIKLFLDVDVPIENCMPTVGSMNGGFASFMVSGRRFDGKDTILFLDPGFPVHKLVVKMLGMKQESFDVYDYRGPKLREKLTELFEKGNISAMLYSNPNNPTWICLTDEELQIIAEVANKYAVVIIEDLAYFGMDFRKDYSKPGQPPFQPTVAKYTDKYILLISSSKSFTYPGQRVGMLAVSDKLYHSKYENLLKYFSSDEFGNALLYGAIYLATAGVSHSPQYGLAAMLKAANDGEFDFLEEVKEYARKAEIMKKIFTENGFHIVYDMDGEEPLADGFYFTVAYPGLEGDVLAERLLYYGISSIPLSSTGSVRTEGIRACVSLVKRDEFPILEERLRQFNKDHQE